MNRLVHVVFATLLAISMPLYAGVEMYLVTTDSEGAVTETVTVYAQSGKIRVEDMGDAAGQDMSMIFVGEEFIVVDHAAKSYIVMDEALVQELGSKVNSVMEQVRAQYADMEPEDRAVIEELLQGEFSEMMVSPEDTGELRVEEMGAGQWQSGACKQYAVYAGADKVQEICAAPLGDVEGIDEAMAAFRDMTQFINSLAESMPGPLGENMAENPMGLMDRIDGFPVRTVDYVGSRMSAETTLSSVQANDLDPSLFDIPAGYTRQNPFAGQSVQ